MAPYLPQVSGTDNMTKCNKRNTFSTSTCGRCGHWNCEDCIPFKDGKEVKKNMEKREGEKSWVDVLFPVKEKKEKGGKGREKGKDRES
jgi:hypothetical protein